jgi:hypothetical protein
MKMTVIEGLPVSAAADTERMAQVTKLIDRVYKVAEDGLWKDGAARTDVTEVSAQGDVVQPLRHAEATARLGPRVRETHQRLVQPRREPCGRVEQRVPQRLREHALGKSREWGRSSGTCPVWRSCAYPRRRPSPGLRAAETRPAWSGAGRQPARA